ncbi:MAG: hypothetical protein QM820_09965 [Minicystis sp.]
MSTFLRILPVLVGVNLLSGCAVEQYGEDDVGEAESALLTTNTLTTNTLTTNTLTTNTLTTNTLTTNTLTTNTLTTNGAGAPVLQALSLSTPEGEANRAVFHYLVTCALDPSQSVTYSYTDAQGTAHTVTETGAIGLASYWATGPLDDQGKAYVSACIATRINYYGVTVDISLRADIDVLSANTTAYELGAYSYIEGAFWGNLFSDKPYLHSCYRDENVDHSRAAQRECAAGHVRDDGRIEECGAIHIVGSCTNVCRKLWKDGGYYTECGLDADPGTASGALITVGLR